MNMKWCPAELQMMQEVFQLTVHRRSCPPSVGPADADHLFFSPSGVRPVWHLGPGYLKRAGSGLTQYVCVYVSVYVCAWVGVALCLRLSAAGRSQKRLYTDETSVSHTEAVCVCVCVCMCV